ncbi:MAG: Gfo/Idh/MocA family oxidoreductase [Phycisphaerae bacterium]|nr:Gfo/Idh/MocA family oxidoreductase [Phycisphaerae bacterium]
MSNPLTRRQFLGNSGKTMAGMAAGLSVLGPRSMLSSARAADANDRLGIALIGCGGMGRHKLGNFLDTKQVDVLALCDVDTKQMDEAEKMIAEKLKNEPAGQKTPQRFKDFRKVLDMQEVKVVIIATPDHWHAAPMLLACQAEKDVYVEKPCCHNVREGKAMVAAAAKYKRVVQVGTHQRSYEHIQAARDFVRNGELGEISATNTYTYGNESPDGLGSDPDSDPPASVDYNLWLGPAPERKFNKRRFHSSWRWYFDYGCGMVGDWNVHLQDIVMWTLDTPYPTSVCSMGGHYILADDRDTPDTMVTIYKFPPSKLAPKGHVHTYTLRKASGKPWHKGGIGMDFHGTNGFLHMTRGGWEVEPDLEDWNRPGSEPRIDPVKEMGEYHKKDVEGHNVHVENFLECVQSREKPIASIEQHYTSVVACHLANVSLRVGRQIFWNHEKELCFMDEKMTIEDKEANKFLGREYRKGFELPEV